MARPKQDGLFYFSFDTDFFYADKRIKRLQSKFGNDGLIFYIYMLTEIYRNGYYISWNEESAEDAAADLGFKEGFIEQVLAYLRGRSLLMMSKLSTGGTTITSPGIQKRYQEAKKGCKRQIEVDSEIWLLSEEETASCIKVTHNSSNSEKNQSNSEKNQSNSEKKPIKESKVIENKVKEIRNTAYSRPEPENPPQDSSIQIPLNDNSFYVVPLEKIDEWKDAFPAVDIECQLKRMAAWCNANPKRRKTKKGVQRFIVNWLSDNQDKGGRFYSGNSRVIVHQDKKADSKGELESKEKLIDDEEWWRYGPNALEE